MTEPLKTPVKIQRSCDCPCHDGADVFHVVTCCGSILGERGGARRAARAAAQREALSADVLAATAGTSAPTVLDERS